MLLTIHELFDIVLMTVILGFLFMDSFKPPARKNTDVLDQFKNKSAGWWERFLFSVALIAPTVILHELAHKFVAMSFGLQATFHAFYANSTTLMLGVFAIIAKLTGLGFVFLVPGFVSISGTASPLVYSVIAFAGPAVHGLAWLGTKLYLTYGRTKHLSARARLFAVIFMKINGFLFILNMLPIPGIDGFTVYKGLLSGLA